MKKKLPLTSQIWLPNEPGDANSSHKSSHILLNVWVLGVATQSTIIDAIRTKSTNIQCIHAGLHTPLNNVILISHYLRCVVLCIHVQG